MAGLGPRVISWCKPLASPIWKHHQLPTTTAVKVHGAQVVEAVGPRGRIRRGMGFRVEHEKRHNPYVFQCFKKFRTRTWCIFMIFEQKPHVANFVLVLSFNFHFFCMPMFWSHGCFFFLQRAPSLGPWNGVCQLYCCFRVWLRFFSKKRHDIPSSYCKFPYNSKKAKNRYLYIESIAAEKSTYLRSFLDNLFHLFEALWP